MSYDTARLSKEYPRILRDALKLAKSLAGKGKKILKTDLFNETQNLPIKGGVIGNIEGDIYAIEINRKVVNKAIEMGFKNVYQGDIRNLPFSDNEFGVVIDLSTIDHVIEFEMVLSEYNRVLKVGGAVGIIYWSRDEGGHNKSHFYFRREDFVAEASKYFELQREWILYEEISLLRALRGYIGVKK